MLRWTLKLKEVLNKLILSASVPEAAVLPVLLLLVLGMLVVLVVLMVLVVLVVLEELVVFEGEIFKRSISLKKQILEFITDYNLSFHISWIAIKKVIYAELNLIFWVFS